MLQTLGQARQGFVTRHIPMRRELKDLRLDTITGEFSGHKAYPDEKGTESRYVGGGGYTLTLS